MTNLVYSIPIDTIEVLRERAENAATTIRNNRGMLERVEDLFRRRFHYCIDNNAGHFEQFV
jgi:ribosomal protein S6